MLSRTGLLLIGIVFHVVYLFSIFDIYFTSPLVHGMTPQQMTLPPPADRLVLFVADGLRADKIFEEEGKARAPFLHHQKEKGTYGISHTRVPTESRPGHVAIIAGFYEDVSAVTTGWTVNPVDFDSVFNQSRQTWSFGSPDILPMFQQGASDPDRVKTFMYPPEFEDFSGEASHLDTWVFDHVEALFTNATRDPALNKQLREKKVVFFLHLLGLDTNGHGFRPHSEEYHNNIKLVDRGIQKMVDTIEKFYGHDGRTSYVFTADHGMNNRGGHGDGHPDNTRTPLITWGAGINTNVGMHDVKQADIAPLMATLIGIPLPVNSVGELPLDYLQPDEHFRAEAAFTVAREISAQYQVKHDEKQESELFFKTFSQMTGENAPDRIVTQIQHLIHARDYIAAEALANTLVELSLRGLRYFQTYDWLFLRGTITLGYVGWCFYCLVHLIGYDVLRGPVEAYPRVQMLVDLASTLVFAGLAGMIWVQRMPIMYYAYIFFPVLFWNQVLRNAGYLQHAASKVAEFGIFRSLAYAAVLLIFLESLIFSYFYRELLSACFIALSFWPLTTSVRKQQPYLAWGWTAACLCTSVFTLLPVDKESDITMVSLGAALGLAGGYLLLRHLRSNQRVDRRTAWILQAQLVMTLSSLFLVRSTSASLARRDGLPFLNQTLSWGICTVSTFFPFLYHGPADSDYLARLFSIILAFAPLMTLLSISYEMLFYVSLSITGLLWLEMERAHYSPKKLKERPLLVQDARASLLFLFFICVAFFGTGNVASLSSFSLESVYRFVTVFDPFMMGALLIVKILVPFFVLSAIFGVLSSALELHPFSLFSVVLTITDIQTIHFFFFVTDYGSWLEIGTSISHFCIAELFIIFNIILFLLSRVLVGHLVPAGVKSIKTS